MERSKEVIAVAMAVILLMAASTEAVINEGIELSYNVASQVGSETNTIPRKILKNGAVGNAPACRTHGMICVNDAQCGPACYCESDLIGRGYCSGFIFVHTM